MSDQNTSGAGADQVTRCRQCHDAADACYVCKASSVHKPDPPFTHQRGRMIHPPTYLPACYDFPLAAFSMQAGHHHIHTSGTPIIYHKNQKPAKYFSTITLPSTCHHFPLACHHHASYNIYMHHSLSAESQPENNIFYLAIAIAIAYMDILSYKVPCQSVSVRNSCWMALCQKNQMQMCKQLRHCLTCKFQIKMSTLNFDLLQTACQQHINEHTKHSPEKDETNLQSKS